MKGIKAELAKNIDNLKKKKDGHVHELRRYEESLRQEVKDSVSKMNKQMAKSQKSFETEQKDYRKQIEDTESAISSYELDVVTFDEQIE